MPPPGIAEHVVCMCTLFKNCMIGGLPAHAAPAPTNGRGRGERAERGACVGASGVPGIRPAVLPGSILGGHLQGPGLCAGSGPAEGPQGETISTAYLSLLPAIALASSCKGPLLHGLILKQAAGHCMLATSADMASACHCVGHVACVCVAPLSSRPARRCWAHAGHLSSGGQLGPDQWRGQVCQVERHRDQP